MKRYFYTFYVSLFLIICFTGYLYSYRSIDELIALLVFLCLAILDILIHGILTRKFKRAKSGVYIALRGSKAGRLLGK